MDFCCTLLLVVQFVRQMQQKFRLHQYSSKYFEAKAWEFYKTFSKKKKFLENLIFEKSHTTFFSHVRSQSPKNPKMIHNPQLLITPNPDPLHSIKQVPTIWGIQHVQCPCPHHSPHGITIYVWIFIVTQVNIFGCGCLRYPQNIQKYPQKYLSLFWVYAVYISQRWSD